MTAHDPTAQTLPLTKGQQIVADYEMDMIVEPCELAKAIDDALGEAFIRGLTDGRKMERGK